MIATQVFDPVFDCQQIFKSLMHAMARPGKVFSIGQPAGKLASGNPILCATAVTLLDNRCRFHVWNDETLANEIKECTYGIPAPLEDADFLFFPSDTDAGSQADRLLDAVKAGTLTEPHKSAMLFIMLPSLDAPSAVRLEGPGIQGEIPLGLPGEGAQWLTARRKAQWEFPTGVELYFMDSQGQVLCLPRTTLMKEG
jgi:alpha-D-ribose 1-methylphosphonate 5-triphosphate synthase subunit PhnH